MEELQWQPDSGPSLEVQGVWSDVDYNRCADLFDVDSVEAILGSQEDMVP